MKPKHLYFIIVALGAIIFLQNCGHGDEVPETIQVTIPGVKDSFDYKKPKVVREIDTVYVDTIVYFDRQVEIRTPNPVNDSLVNAFAKAQDSIQRLKIFLSAIEIKDYRSIFEDDFIKIQVDGKVQGEIISLRPTYETKERTVEVNNPVKTVRYRLLAGLSSQATFTDRAAFGFQPVIGVQNKKGAVFSAGYGLYGSETTYTFSYMHPLFTRKR